MLRIGASAYQNELNMAFEDAERFIRWADLKIEALISPLFSKDATSNKQSCLNLVRTAPIYLIGQSISPLGLYAVATGCAAWLYSNNPAPAKRELSMKLLQAVGTAFFLNALMKSHHLWKSGAAPADLLSIPLDLVYSTAYFYLSAKQEKQLKEQIRTELRTRSLTTSINCP